MSEPVARRADGRTDGRSVLFQAVAPHPLRPRSPRRVPLHNLGHVPARFQQFRQGCGFRGAEPVGRGRPAVRRAAGRVGLDRRWDQELPVGAGQGLAQTARHSEYLSCAFDVLKAATGCAAGSEVALWSVVQLVASASIINDH